MTTIKMQIARFRWILIAFLSIAAAISLRVGIRGAIFSSKDFQWAGAYLVRMRIDPWQQGLLDNGAHVSNFSPPNYLHELYILLMPISFLSFHHAAEFWCCFNILLSIACIYLLKNLFSLSWIISIGILLLLWMSTPFRTTLQVGQMGVLELFLLSIVFCTSNSTLRGLALGLSFSKYSFAPVVVSFLWFRRNIRTLTIAVILPVLALLLTWGMLGGSLSDLATEPFAIARIKVWPGMADLMTCTETVLARLFPNLTTGKTLAYGLGLLISGIYGFYLSHRKLSEGAQLALIAVASLFTIKHLMYDYIFLVIPLCYVASDRGKSLRNIAVPLIGIFWFMDKLFPLLPMNAPASTAQVLTSVAGCCMLGTLLVYLTWSIVRIERAYGGRQFHATSKISTANADAVLVV